MADDNEEGGVVTTVKTGVTQDLDVQNILDEQAENLETQAAELAANLAKAKEAKEAAHNARKDDAQPTSKRVTKDTKEKPGEGADTGAAKDGEDGKPVVQAKKSEEDGEDDKLDFKSLSPAQQKAVEKLYRDRRAEKRDAKALKAKLDELEARIAGNNRPTAPVATKTTEVAPQLVRPKPPIASNYKNEKEFEAAQIEYEDKVYKYRQALQAAETQQAETLAADQAAVEKFNKQARKFAKDHEDYTELVDESDAITSPFMFGAIVENGPALAYFFAKNPDRATEISEMDDKRAGRAIERIMIKLEDEADENEDGEKDKGGKKTKADGEQPVVPATKKQPIAPVTARKTPAPQVPDKSKMTFKERERIWAKEHPGALNYTP